MAVSLNYRGDVKPQEANHCVNWLKENKKVSFVDWSPTGFKVGLNDEPPAILEEDDIAGCSKHVSMIGNNTCISRVFSERIGKKYDILYSQYAFVHWYLGEGPGCGIFPAAREELAWLEKDYLDVLCDYATDHDDDWTESEGTDEDENC
mmetsp:Transcript_77206/g.69137  ORF Transcript_77206/g.69137 Transcript_77206/m.69137 type:complete len:149 (+) Transcript_77206:2-448(+)